MKTIEWKYIVSKEYPVCFNTGDFEGKISNKLVIQDEIGDHFVGYCYENRDSRYETYYTFVDAYDNQLALDVVQYFEIPF